ncbi:putative Integrator complex subunit 11 [Monocercomonoides exilis]|uniref:putative Integrator complex subunit 11 n=1 Tax=Monocercomonoides exilis TaxID=2049356 RepID=UPI003559DB7A|nr:putative Integrator complex subunit 11 [Monocercomonoides exilis]|eukprot:MONOS_2205.1-p1 / transcript=MONOS_2205.1 / gene=MONOS_2205 / organism=Monocercomonoides_exilis_PA203 / gene_product=Integrator complex subunit 11 / transcript_product=Integrator complex subunit 11 / location=Mono_scaffold00044:4744-7662(+) / protein_length=972 / sequence_SO=supercontig / SO=protein_coding / is_pseudo=false
MVPSSVNEISITPLGAGCEVGRSCIIVELCGKRIMFDCGIHMGFSDDRRFPRFESYYDFKKPLTGIIDCCIISHFHLDHIGALPYLTEMVGFDGPVFMTFPTRAIAQHTLEDLRKVSTDRRNKSAKEDEQQKFQSSQMFTAEMITACLNKVVPLSDKQTYVHHGIEITPYLCGHILGAASFLVKVEDASVLYMGDFNTSSDGHLRGAHLPRCRPSVLISESTYCTTIRGSKLKRERLFVEAVTSTVLNGGKVLIPAFALGRVQELCLLLEDEWSRRGMTIPVWWTTGGLAGKALASYERYRWWMNERVQKGKDEGTAKRSRTNLMKMITSEVRRASNEIEPFDSIMIHKTQKNKEEKIECVEWNEEDVEICDENLIDTTTSKESLNEAKTEQHQNLAHSSSFPLSSSSSALEALSTRNKFNDLPYTLFPVTYSPTLSISAISPFSFAHITSFQQHMLYTQGPCVLFASPGMLNGGLSLEALRAWGGDASNAVLIPGYCVEGTVGNALLKGIRHIKTENISAFDVNCRVASFPFSAHADAGGIIDAINEAEPKCVVLVHGEKEKMMFAQQIMLSLCGVKCYVPSNGEKLVINTEEKEDTKQKDKTEGNEDSKKTDIMDNDEPSAKKEKEEDKANTEEEQKIEDKTEEKEKNVIVLNLVDEKEEGEIDVETIEDEEETKSEETEDGAVTVSDGEDDESIWINDLNTCEEDGEIKEIDSIPSDSFLSSSSSSSSKHVSLFSEFLALSQESTSEHSGKEDKGSAIDNKISTMESGEAKDTNSSNSGSVAARFARFANDKLKERPFRPFFFSSADPTESFSCDKLCPNQLLSSFDSFCASHKHTPLSLSSCNELLQTSFQNTLRQLSEASKQPVKPHSSTFPPTLYSQSPSPSPSSFSSSIASRRSASAASYSIKRRAMRTAHGFLGSPSQFLARRSQLSMSYSNLGRAAEKKNNRRRNRSSAKRNGTERKKKSVPD